MLSAWLVSGAHRFYTSKIITGVTSEHSLDIDNFTVFNNSLLYPLNKPFKMISTDPLWGTNSIAQCSYSTCNASYLRDGHGFTNKKQSLTVPPKESSGIKISMYLIPENSAYVGGYSAITVDCFIDVYKLLGGRQFCTDTSLFWLKGSTTKLGMQLQISALKQRSGVDFDLLQADFMRTPYNKIEAIKLLHMTLASYSYVTNLVTVSDDLCNELALLIYNDAVLPWKSDAPASIISNIKNEWLKPSLIL